MFVLLTFFYWISHVILQSSIFNMRTQKFWAPAIYISKTYTTMQIFAADNVLKILLTLC